FATAADTGDHPQAVEVAGQAQQGPAHAAAGTVDQESEGRIRHGGTLSESAGRWQTATLRAPSAARPRMPRAKKHAPIRLPLLVLAVLTLVLQLAGWLDRLDDRLGDLQLQRHAAGREPPADIVLVAIDQKSLEDLRSEEHTSELQSRENLVC